MKIKLGYSMGFAGTDSEWTEEIPQEVVEEGKEAIEHYLETVLNSIYEMACEHISIWGHIEEAE